MRTAKTEPVLPIPAAVRWSAWALLAGLLLVVIASFATLPLKWGEFFSADALRTTADFLHGFAPPEAAAELVSYTIYRWECAIRGSVVMGFVGAGGLGQRMDESMKMMAGSELATMLMVFVLLVAGADAVSAMLRRRLA